MSNELSERSQKALARSFWGGFLGLGILFVSVGVGDEGVARILGVGVGLASVALAFTSVPWKLASRVSTRSSTRMTRFWALWVSAGSVIVGLLAAFFPTLVLIAGAPVTFGFATLVVGPAIGSLINLYVLASNLVVFRSA